MTLFAKNKKKPPALLYSLNQKLNEEKARGNHSFWYPLDKHEVDQAIAWAVRNRVMIKPDYLKDKQIYYKVEGF